MRKLSLVLACGAAIAVSPAQAQTQTYTNYECTDGAHFELVFFKDARAAYLQFDGKSVKLPKRFSVTSQRFSKDGISLSLKRGGTATIRRAGKTSQCKLK